MPALKVESKIEQVLSQETEAGRKAALEKRLENERAKQEQLKVDNTLRKEALKSAGSKYVPSSKALHVS